MAQTRRFVVFPAALRRLSTRACLIGLIIVFGTAPAHCAVLSMQEFLSRRAKWETYANKSRPTNLILEGRYSSSAGASFRLQKCDVIFQPKRGVKLPVVRDKETRLEVSGHLKRVAARYVFVVERMRERTSHRDMLADARTRMEKSDPERWIELGQSNVAISEFYGDEKLLKATQTLFREAIARKREQLKPATESALRALATRAVKLGLPQETAEEFIHDALWIRWNQDRKNDKADLRKLLQQVATDFPSAKNPLQEFNRISSQAYLRQPAFLFARSNSKQRKTLQRYFYMHINEFIINKGLKPDYSNGFEIARQYEKEIPERSDLAESLRVKELAWREQSINRLSKNEMRQLARMHTDRGDANKARGVLETWFTFHDARLRKQGPAGLITLGDDYLNELHDKDKATAAFKEAWTYLQNHHWPWIANRWKANC